MVHDGVCVVYRHCSTQNGNTKIRHTPNQKHDSANQCVFT